MSSINRKSKETDKLPPKIHKLSYFVDKLKLSPTKEMQDFFESMDDASVATRYPDSLKEISNKYKKTNTKTILAKNKNSFEMDKRRANKIVKFVTDKLMESGLDVYKVILFGSYYNGKPHKDSDIDVAVISDDFKGKDIWNRAPMTGEIVRAVIRKFDISIDLIKLTVDEYENETRMIASYVKEGKVFYSAN